MRESEQARNACLFYFLDLPQPSLSSFFLCEQRKRNEYTKNPHDGRLLRDFLKRDSTLLFRSPEQASGGWCIQVDRETKTIALLFHLGSRGSLWKFHRLAAGAKSDSERVGERSWNDVEVASQVMGSRTVSLSLAEENHRTRRTRDACSGRSGQRNRPLACAASSASRRIGADEPTSRVRAILNVE